MSDEKKKPKKGDAEIPVLEESLRRQMALQRWIEDHDYFETDPLGKTLRQQAGLYRIALRNCLADLSPEWAARRASKKKHKR